MIISVAALCSPSFPADLLMPPSQSPTCSKLLPDAYSSRLDKAAKVVQEEEFQVRLNNVS